MFIKIWWSKNVICSAISRADKVSILSLLATFSWVQFKCISLSIKILVLKLTNGIDSNESNWCRAQCISSRVSKRISCEAARCSDGNKFGLHVISSRNIMACLRNVSSCSKSWKCLETQCLDEKCKNITLLFWWHFNCNTINNSLNVYNFCCGLDQFLHFFQCILQFFQFEISE